MINPVLTREYAERTSESKKESLDVFKAPFTRVRTNFCTDELCLDRLFTWIRKNSVAAVLTWIRAKFTPVAVFNSRP